MCTYFCPFLCKQTRINWRVENSARAKKKIFKWYYNQDITIDILFYFKTIKMTWGTKYLQTKIAAAATNDNDSLASVDLTNCYRQYQYWNQNLYWYRYQYIYWCSVWLNNNNSKHNKLSPIVITDTNIDTDTGAVFYCCISFFSLFLILI